MLAALLFSLATISKSEAGEPAIEIGHCRSNDTFVLAVHGGAAWGRSPRTRRVQMIEALLPKLGERLDVGARALDVVEAAVKAMEDSGLFNAGKGAIANQAAEIELDAAIMDGRDLSAGAVAAVSRLKNPIAAARLVMERSGNVLLVAEGAERYTMAEGAEEAKPGYFLQDPANTSDVPLPSDIEIVPPSEDLPPELAAFSGSWSGQWNGALNQVLIVERIGPDGGTLVYAQGVNEDWGIPQGLWERLPFEIHNQAIVFERFLDGSPLATQTYRILTADRLSSEALLYNGLRGSGTLWRHPTPSRVEKGGTVGAVALDRCGDLAAALSTGGFGSKRPGRVGDSPIVGAGLYAKNGVAALAPTGQGEYFLRGVLAYQLIALMEHGGFSLEDAGQRVIHESLAGMGGKGGIVAVGTDGRVTMPYNTDGMVRGVIGSEIALEVTVF